MLKVRTSSSMLTVGRYSARLTRASLISVCEVVLPAQLSASGISSQKSGKTLTEHASIATTFVNLFCFPCLQVLSELRNIARK